MKQCTNSSNTIAERVNNNTILEVNTMKTIAIAITTNKGICGTLLSNCEWFEEIYLQAYGTPEGAKIALRDCVNRCKPEMFAPIECKTRTGYVQYVQERTGSDEIKCYLYDNNKLRWRVTEPRWCSVSAIFYDRVSLSGERIYDWDLDYRLDELIISRYATLKDMQCLSAQITMYGGYMYNDLLKDWVDRVIYNMQHDGRKTYGYHDRMYWNDYEKCWCHLDNDRICKSLLVTDKSTGECHCYIPKHNRQTAAAYEHLFNLFTNMEDPYLRITTDYYWQESVTVEVKLCGFNYMLPGYKYTCTSKDALWLQQYIKLNNLDYTVTIK